MARPIGQLPGLRPKRSPIGAGRQPGAHWPVSTAQPDSYAAFWRP